MTLLLQISLLCWSTTITPVIVVCSRHSILQCSRLNTLSPWPISILPRHPTCLKSSLDSTYRGHPGFHIHNVQSRHKTCSASLLPPIKENTATAFTFTVFFHPPNEPNLKPPIGFFLIVIFATRLDSLLTCKTLMLRFEARSPWVAIFIKSAIGPKSNSLPK